MITSYVSNYPNEVNTLTLKMLNLQEKYFEVIMQTLFGTFYSENKAFYKL